MLFMHVGFGTLQVIGFVCLFMFYTGELLHFYLVRDVEGIEKEVQIEMAKRRERDEED